MSRPDLQINTDNEYDDQDQNDDQRDDDEIYTDEESDSASIDSDIDFGLSYALHTFVATVEGQASVVKGDSLQLLDDSNSYWWLVNVLKTEDVGYIPAENIETPFERLARLNKFRNVDLAAATQEEKAVGANSRLQLINVTSPQDQPRALSPSPSFVEESATRRIGFGPPTFVDHPGDNPDWSEESDDGEYGEGGEIHDERHEGEGSDGEHERALEDDGMGEDSFGDEGESNVLDGMEPDDGMSWDDEAGAEDQAVHLARASANGSSGFARPDPNGLIDPSTYKEGPQAQQVQLVDQARKASEHLDPHSIQHFADSPASSQQTNHSQIALGRVLSPSQNHQSQSHPSHPSTSPSHNSPSSPIKSSSSRDFLDPALETGETRRIFATPVVARSSPPTSYFTGESLQPEMKRNVSHGSIASSTAESTDGERESDVNSPNGEGKVKKKSSVFGSFFKKKDKKDKGIRASTVLGGGGSEAGDSKDDTSSFEDGSTHRPSLQESPGPVRTSTSSSSRFSTSSQSDARKVSALPLDQTSPTSASHSLRLQQIDQKQQALYQQYLAQSVHSPDANSNPSLSYGTQAAAAVAQSSASQRLARASTGSTPKPRPGSLLITSAPLSAVSADGGASSNAPVVSMLSVLRVFAGQAVESESTFKTVLLSESTMTYDLLQQALQRFGVEKQETRDDYYLTVKGVDGDEEVLGPDRHPLVVLNALNQEDTDIPTIRRSSIDSISSNLSLNPAIARLGDWSDDSIVKLYLNKRSTFDPSSSTSSSTSAASETDSNLLIANSHAPQLGGPVSTNRFTLQLVIYPEDLPDGMVFDTTTEAIVPRSALKNRSAPTSPVLGPDSSVSLSERRKFLLFPANTTVAEAVEVGLDRFGISDGVVDGGDEVEDKLSQRKSVARVRYGLSARDQAGQERDLQPSTKLLDIYATPPTLRSQPITDARERRRSREVPTAKPDDILPTDPTFVIRKAQPRPTNLSVAASLQHNRRSRSSVYSDEDGSRQRVSRTSSLHSVRSQKTSHRSSRSSTGSEKTIEDRTIGQGLPSPSPREVIASQQDVVVQFSQFAIPSASANPQTGGVDLVLSNDLGTVHSTRLFVPSKNAEEVRYRYIEPKGEIEYDISQLVGEEWKTPDDGVGSGILSSIAKVLTGSPKIGGDEPEKEDVLQVALGGDSDASASGGDEERKAGELAEKLERIVQKVRNGGGEPLSPASSLPTTTPSSNMFIDQSSSIPIHARQTSITPSQLTTDLPYRHSEDSQRSPASRSYSTGLPSSTNSPFSESALSNSQQTLPSTTISSTSSTPTPSQALRSGSSASTHRDVAPSSSASLTPNSSNPITASTARTTPAPADYRNSTNTSEPSSRPRLFITRDDFGIKNMLAVIAARSRDPHSSSRSLAFSSSSGLSKARGPDEVEKQLFGERVLDPTPAWEGKRAFVEIQKQLDSMDRELDSLLDRVLAKGLTSTGSN